MCFVYLDTVRYYGYYSLHSTLGAVVIVRATGG